MDISQWFHSNHTVPLAFWCVFAAGLLPYVATLIAKWGRSDFDNHHPREWESKLEGFRARAHAAQQNSFEAFPFFAAAVVMAYLLQGAAPWLNALALLWVVLRVLYLYCYLSNRAALRSLVWLAGLAVVIAIVVLAA